MSDIAINMEGLGKKYSIRHAAPTSTSDSVAATLLARMHRWWRHGTNSRTSADDNEVEDIWVLKDIDLDFRRGEVVGIIGRNGAFAEYLQLPAKNLLRVPDSVSDHEAVFTEPLAAACEILDAPRRRVSAAGRRATW